MPPDLYSDLLHLPPGPRPPNHYELLGLPLFEPDPKVIHAAVLRQTAELKRWALDPRPGRLERVQEMLNEVGRAGFDLEDTKKRADYERQLAERLGVPLPQREAAEVVPPSPPAAKGPGGAARRAARRRAEATPESDSAAGLRPARSPALISALAMGIPLAAAALFWVGFLLGRRSSSEERDLAIQRSAKAMEAQAAAEARAGQLAEEAKKALAQAAVEAKARAAAEGQAKTLGQAPKSRAAEAEQLNRALDAAKEDASKEAKARLAAEADAKRLAEALKEKEAEAKSAAARPLVPMPQTPDARLIEPKPGPFEVYTSWPFAAAEAKRRQEETARALGVPVEQEIDLGGGVKMAFVLIPAGEFMMGDDVQGPVHRVTLSRPFWLGKHEVSQAQWEAVMGNNPSEFKGRDLPVETVSWNDCNDFCNRLMEKEQAAGKIPKSARYQLPTEAEWEYACRAGSASRFSCGDTDVDLGQHAWCSQNSNRQTHPVGQNRPNAWGLCDMHGNVWEWCWDWSAPYLAAEQRDPSGPLNGQYRVVRGGSWCGTPVYCRSAYRGGNSPDRRHPDGGFRVVLVPGP